jgi:hypothetical protein
LYFIILYFIFFSIKGSTLAQRTPERLKYDSIENHLVSDEKGSLNRDYFMVPVSQSFWSVIPLAYEEGENLESLEVMRLGNNLIFAELYEKLKDITESQKVYNEELAHTSTSYHESLFKIVNYTETLQPKFIFLLEKLFSSSRLGQHMIIESSKQIKSLQNESRAYEERMNFFERELIELREKASSVPEKDPIPFHIYVLYFFFFLQMLYFLIKYCCAQRKNNKTEQISSPANTTKPKNKKALKLTKGKKKKTQYMFNKEFTEEEIINHNVQDEDSVCTLLTDRRNFNMNYTDALSSIEPDINNSSESNTLIHDTTNTNHAMNQESKNGNDKRTTYDVQVKKRLVNLSAINKSSLQIQAPSEHSFSTIRNAKHHFGSDWNLKDKRNNENGRGRKEERGKARRMEREVYRHNMQNENQFLSSTERDENPSFNFFHPFKILSKALYADNSEESTETRYVRKRNLNIPKSIRNVSSLKSFELAKNKCASVKSCMSTYEEHNKRNASESNIFSLFILICGFRI